MKLRHLLLTHVALFAIGAATPSLAAPPFPPGSYNRTGPYIGGEGGYGWGNSNQSDPGRPPAPPPAPPPPRDDTGAGAYSMRGGFIGGSAGYNWQTGPWVLGIEGDYSWANITGSSMSCGFAPRHGCGTTLQSFGTLRGRVGYATEPGGAWLPYVTGGLAAGELQAWDALTPASGNAFRGGWSLGAGGRNRACSKLDLQGRVSLHGPWFSADVQHCARRAGNRQFQGQSRPGGRQL
jgi:outer membrane immunogenic protein